MTDLASTHRSRGPIVICSAHRSDGQPCKRAAINGGTVCYNHGGRAPQVIRAAKLRLALAADAVAASLVRIATSKNEKASDIIAAARDVLDRAGVRAEREQITTGATDGTVLWEEFVQIYRRVHGAPPE